MKHAVAFMLALIVPAASGEPSTLFQAIRNGDVPTVKRHLTKAEVNGADARGVTPLMHAAAFGNIETLRALLDAGAEVNARNRADATALLWAAGDVEKAWEHGQCAWAVGRALDDGTRKTSTLPYVGEALVRLSHARQGEQAAQDVESDVVSVLGKDWRPKAVAAGGQPS